MGFRFAALRVGLRCAAPERQAAAPRRSSAPPLATRHSPLPSYVPLLFLTARPSCAVVAALVSPLGSCRDHRLSSGGEAVLRGVLGGMPPGRCKPPWSRRPVRLACARPLVTTHQALNGSTARGTRSRSAGRWLRCKEPCGMPGRLGRPRPLPCPSRAPRRPAAPQGALTLGNEGPERASPSLHPPRGQGRWRAPTGSSGRPPRRRGLP
jgi:hypothetical protein